MDYWKIILFYILYFLMPLLLSFYYFIHSLTYNTDFQYSILRVGRYQERKVSSYPHVLFWLLSIQNLLKILMIFYFISCIIHMLFILYQLYKLYPKADNFDSRSIVMHSIAVTIRGLSYIKSLPEVLKKCTFSTWAGHDVFPLEICFY